MTPTDKFIRQHASWAAFFDAATALPEKASGASPDKGKVFERLTQLYLKTNPEYQTKLREVWIAHVDLPSRVRIKLNLPDDDEGIDLIAETFTGEFWAIQCKFRSDTGGALTVRELSTFTNLCFNVCRDVSLAVVAHTCSKPVRKHHLLGNTTEIGLQRWLEIEEEEWLRIQAVTTGPAPPPRRRTPRDHQEAAVKAAKAHFLTGNATRGKLLMPCGTGKSLTAFWIAQALGPKSIVVAVPSLSLIKQSLLDWTREFIAHGEVPEWLCVCSDETTGNLDRDEFVNETYELGIDATTDPDAISRFLGADNGKRKIVFTTYQSGKVLAKAAGQNGFEFDLGIMDEAHRTVGVKDKSFAHLVSNDNLPIRQRIFMTATERISRGSDDEVLSMDDVATYGDCFYQLSFKQAIESDPPIISDYRILTITVSDAHVRELIEENRYLTTPDQPMDEREAQSLAAGIALQRAFGEYGVRHAISFHRSIRAAEDFRTQHEQIVSLVTEPPSCFHVSSRKSTGERARLMQQFRDTPAALITNARCLQEGVDIPAVDCVLFADPKQSVVDIVQAAGRAMRPYPGKQFGYIVIPIIVPSGMDFDVFAETTEFRRVASVITALSTQDGRIAEEFRALEGRPRNGGRIVEICGDVKIGYRIDLVELQEKIRLKLWQRIGRANWRSFRDARSYVHTLSIPNQKAWIAYCGSGCLPPDIPSNPHIVYSETGWKSLGDWLGTGSVASFLRVYRSFEAARGFARGLKLKSRQEWNRFCQTGSLPEDIPAYPEQTYRDKGWLGVSDWLGTSTVHPRDRTYRPFPAARSFAQSLNLKNRAGWYEYAKSNSCPKDIPAAPDRVYRNDGWVSFGDWLGTGFVANQLRKFQSFEQARAYVHTLGLKSQTEWIPYCKAGNLPVDIPAYPNKTYSDVGWISWGDWLGSGTVAFKFRKIREFTLARSYVQNLGLKSNSEWREFVRNGKLPTDIPATPERIYGGEGWSGWGDWLGTGSTSWRYKRYLPFEEARDFVRSLNLKTGDDWKTYCRSGRLPGDIPQTPRQIYSNDGWIGMGDWLGTGTIAKSRRKFRPFEEARNFARSLKLKSRTEWSKYAKTGLRPDDIPSTPSNTYKNKGWKGMGDWLGWNYRAARKSV